ncbi:organic hydroperoxide resistance protein [Rhizobacter sp. OV335]|uniref:organic hydroperoxide resistance protein n=1 Tax=Rhizobacter sp. OV335 TaxID=1500264 RepID=UPI00091D99F2|nr:organic hydroperoxide resistance protein [Rhizobacter sp. OV335]SHL97942.1 peroxiredoxin, Ohr subfamily [Rhizobacter sp. OV335]
MLQKIANVLYTAATRTTGGRDGAGRSSDGALDVQLSPPGSGKPGTNPEQLFGVGYSACFMGAMQIAARQLSIKFPADTAIDARVSLGKTAGDASYALAVTLSISLPGLDADVKRRLVDAAHQTCPYSAATRGNIEVDFVIA